MREVLGCVITVDVSAYAQWLTVYSSIPNSSRLFGVVGGWNSERVLSGGHRGCLGRVSSRIVEDISVYTDEYFCSR